MLIVWFSPLETLQLRKKLIDRYKGFTDHKHSEKNRKKMSEKGKIKIRLNDLSE